ncbi:MAG: hypothetical protein AUJ58_02840 [Zetaproteobacteria bacterium CG1_02_55_237]|nr:MAG: hypothetical protein AUJ58_02840 [Zetaproteobacteria bacterium CG1_02_55_237]
MTTSQKDKTDQEPLAKPENAPHSDARVRVGERLSQARQAKEIGYGDASDRLRIRRAYLEALESGDWSSLPEEVYVMGFLRQYAALLGVDISQDIDALKTGDYKLTKPFTMPDPPIAMNRIWAVAAGACFLLLLILFNVVDEGEKDLPAPAPIADLPMASPPAPDISAMQAPSDADVSAEAPVPQAQTESAQETITTTEDRTASKLAGDAAPAQPGEQNVVKADTAPTSDSSAANTAQNTDSHTYRLSAVGQDVWLQVHAQDGSLLKEALLRRGQSMHLNTGGDYVLLTTGNPLALKVYIDGRMIAEAGSLGEKDKVLRDYRLQAPAAPADSGH